ncbi:MAG: PPOX class probable F420-dependent enzyme [Acidimicrobiales bacterium]|jgi:PPOX class probable F420-dependent enzyme
MDDSEPRARLRNARSATLGTLAPNGTPHLVPCCFVLASTERTSSDSADVVYSAVDGKPKSTMALRRLDNIRAQPRASLLADWFAEDWSALWWVRVDGEARVITEGAERDTAIDLLVAKYSQYRAHRPEGAVVAIDVTQWRSWQAKP